MGKEQTRNSDRRNFTSILIILTRHDHLNKPSCQNSNLLLTFHDDLSLPQALFVQIKRRHNILAMSVLTFPVQNAM